MTTLTTNEMAARDAALAASKAADATGDTTPVTTAATVEPDKGKPVVLPDLTKPATATVEPGKPQGGKPTTTNPHVASQGGTVTTSKGKGKATTKATTTKPAAKGETPKPAGTVGGFDMSLWGAKSRTIDGGKLVTCQPPRQIHFDILRALKIDGGAKPLHKPGTLNELCLAYYCTAQAHNHYFNYYDVGFCAARPGHGSGDHKGNTVTKAVKAGLMTYRNGSAPMCVDANGKSYVSKSVTLTMRGYAMVKAAATAGDWLTALHRETQLLPPEIVASLKKAAEKAAGEVKPEKASTLPVKA